VRVAAFTFNSFLMALRHLSTPQFGDPVVLYDTFEDRWIITDFALRLSGETCCAVFQCFAVSQSGDPVGGGWNFYSTRPPLQPRTASTINPQVRHLSDGLYMSANMFPPSPEARSRTCAYGLSTNQDVRW